MAATYTLNITQGATFLVEAMYTGFDLTDYLGRCQIRAKADSTSAIVATPTVTITDATTGKFTIGMTAAETSAIPVTGASYADVTTYVYDVEMYKSNGTVYRVLQGFAKVSPEVTRSV